jgi:hypothetical protein
MFLSRAVSVATTATALHDATTQSSILVFNNHSATIYVGGPGVTTSTGIPVAAGTGISFDYKYGEIYGIVAAATADVRILELG